MVYIRVTTSLGPRPPPWSSICVHNNTGARNRKIGKNQNREGLGAFITWMTSGGRGTDVGVGRGPMPRQSVRALHRVFGIQTLAWRKLLVLTGKKLVFKLVRTYLNISSSLPMSTSCPLTWWMLPGLPIFRRSRVLLWMQTKVKTEEAWEWD